ncbi:unnamed protein product [Leptidea sinapis]|uniref:Uncharacterized protein n=1 Tax=Leptidea sinapis TaxID=189913 RepID=A0A5E4QRV8_9NEOP|nr:unnamed protein product [Leptidea sinapis]
MYDKTNLHHPHIHAMVSIALFHTPRGPTSRNLSIIAGGRAIAHQSVEPPCTAFNGSTPTSSTFIGSNAQARKFISPLEFRGLRKADPRKGSRAARRKEPPCTAFNGSTPTSSTFIGSNAQARKFISPLEFRGLRKADPRKGSRAARRKGKTMIATDTPEKDQI